MPKRVKPSVLGKVLSDADVASIQVLANQARMDRASFAGAVFSVGLTAMARFLSHPVDEWAPVLSAKTVIEALDNNRPKRKGAPSNVGMD